MATETQTQIESDELKEAFMTDNRDKLKYNATEISSNPKTICFEKLIPYSSSSLPDDKLAVICPFVAEQDSPLNLCREYFIVSFIICILCVFSTIIQCWFVLYGPSPYRWISLGFLLFAQLISILWSGAMFVFAHNEAVINRNVCILCIISLFFLFPIIPVAICIMISVIESKHDFERANLSFKCFICLFVGIFQTLPQMIILIIMFANHGYELSMDTTEVINWSFLSSLLNMVSFCIIFASIYEETIIYVLSIIWLCLDYTIYLFILSVIFYDNIGLIIFIIDVSIVCIPWLIIPMLLVYGQLNDMSSFSLFCILIGMECVIIVFIPLILLIFGPWTLFCFLSQILHCNVLPFCINSTSMELIECTEEWLPYWYKYRIFKWIKKGNNREEMDVRLCCVNMIILDKYYQNQLNQLKKGIATNINCVDFAKKSRKLISANNELCKIRENFRSKWSKSILREMSKTIMYSIKLYVVIRIIHMMIPIIIGVYIGYKEHWKIDNINFIIKYLGFTAVFFYLLLIISLYLVWKYTFYHKMIIPFVQEIGNDDFKNCSLQIANCYAVIGIVNVITDWIENRDIAYIIFQMMYQ